jgi:hypothetical protein
MIYWSATGKTWQSDRMANMTTNDPLVDISEAAARMGVKEKRARIILAKNLVRPVRTAQGIRYRLDDVRDVKRMYQQ